MKLGYAIGIQDSTKHKQRGNIYAMYHPPVELITAEGQWVKQRIWIFKGLEGTVVINNICSYTGKDNIILAS